MNDSNKEYRTRLCKNGLTALSVALVLLLAIILVNVVATALPADVKKLDMTDQKMYSVSDSTKREVAKNETAVELYLISSGGEAGLASDGVQLDAFLDNLAAVNKKISYKLIDSLIEPDFAASMGLESVANMSVIVKSPLRSRVLNLSDFFSYYIDGVGKVNETNAMYYYYYYGLTPTYVFDGEALLLGALRYVTDPNLPVMYMLSGHSETALSTTLLEILDSANITAASVTLSTLNSVPADCDLLLINAPQTDFTEAETQLLLRYLENGGTVMLVTTPDSCTFTNLSKITAAMGLSAEPGFVIETESSHYYNAQYPYYLIPSATFSGIGGKGTVLPFAHGIRMNSELPNGIKTTSLFSTSSEAYMVPVNAETVEKTEDSEVRSYCVGAISQNTSGGGLIWVASNGFTADSPNTVGGGANYSTFLSAVTWVCGESTSATNTTPVSLVSERLEVSQTSAGLLSVILTILLPLAIVGYGGFCLSRRKKK